MYPKWACGCVMPLLPILCYANGAFFSMLETIKTSIAATVFLSRSTLQCPARCTHSQRISCTQRTVTALPSHFLSDGQARRRIVLVVIARRPGYLLPTMRCIVYSSTTLATSTYLQANLRTNAVMCLYNSVSW
ncbi:hypothetical protein EDD16DRAFT_1541380 [Pisolithus croceorrhizus]|nr:hypothetical protein EDD16DRAFT_1541380 [Pisolithus croceorrhizus]